MSFDRIGVTRRLFLSALLVLATLVIAQQPSQGQPQSLGDVARQARAERQRSGAARRVYTNDDLASSSADAAQAKSAEGDGQAAQADASTGKAAEGSAAATDETAKKKEQEELQKHAQEVDHQYLDKIAGIQTQIATANQELERLQRDQLESTNQFRSSNGVSPTLYEYQSQQRYFEEQIESRRNLIASLNSQLEDAKEAARHAGVRHAGD